MATVAARPLTTADLLAMPNDGKRRWLLRGELRESSGEPDGKPMTIRNRFHSKATANVATFLNLWRFSQPEPWGDVVCGEAGVRLPGDPESTVGVDVAYVPPDVVIRQTGATTLIDGVPTLIVEIVSPSNRADDVGDKILAYLDAGVPLVWVVNPQFRTVTIYRPGDEHELVNVHEELTGGDALPGFRVPVARLFA